MIECDDSIIDSTKLIVLQLFLFFQDASIEEKVAQALAKRVLNEECDRLLKDVIGIFSIINVF